MSCDYRGFEDVCLEQPLEDAPVRCMWSEVHLQGPTGADCSQFDTSTLASCAAMRDAGACWAELPCDDHGIGMTGWYNLLDGSEVSLLVFPCDLEPVMQMEVTWLPCIFDDAGTLVEGNPACACLCG